MDSDRSHTHVRDGRFSAQRIRSMQDKTKEGAALLLQDKIRGIRERGLVPGDLSERERNSLDDLLWEVMRLWAGDAFFTAKGLEFTYTIRGNEMFVSRKDKSLTRATVNLAFYKALLLQKEAGRVTGPKKLGTFGASYLYPIFIGIGVINS